MEMFLLVVILTSLCGVTGQQCYHRGMHFIVGQSWSQYGGCGSCQCVSTGTIICTPCLIGDTKHLLQMPHGKYEGHVKDKDIPRNEAVKMYTENSIRSNVLRNLNRNEQMPVRNSKRPRDDYKRYQGDTHGKPKTIEFYHRDAEDVQLDIRQNHDQKSELPSKATATDHYKKGHGDTKEKPKAIGLFHRDAEDIQFDIRQNHDHKSGNRYTLSELPSESTADGKSSMKKDVSAEQLQSEPIHDKKSLPIDEAPPQPVVNIHRSVNEGVSLDEPLFELKDEKRIPQKQYQLVRAAFSESDHHEVRNTQGEQRGISDIVRAVRMGSMHHQARSNHEGHTEPDENTHEERMKDIHATSQARQNPSLRVFTIGEGWDVFQGEQPVGADLLHLDGCQVGDGYLQAGQVWDAGDGCNFCFCVGYGKVACTSSLCGCTLHGTTVPVMGAVQAGDGCNVCICAGNGMLGCTELTCEQ